MGVAPSGLGDGGGIVGPGAYAPGYSNSAPSGRVPDAPGIKIEPLPRILSPQNPPHPRRRGARGKLRVYSSRAFPPLRERPPPLRPPGGADRRLRRRRPRRDAARHRPQRLRQEHAAALPRRPAGAGRRDDRVSGRGRVRSTPPSAGVWPAWSTPDLAFYAELTVRENLEFFSRLRRTTPERGLAVLDRLGLPLDRMAGALSSGMRQRLRWAWALLHSPRLLLLDEPFQNFDAPARARRARAPRRAPGRRRPRRGRQPVPPRVRTCGRTPRPGPLRRWRCSPRSGGASSAPATP